MLIVSRLVIVPFILVMLLLFATRVPAAPSPTENIRTATDRVLSVLNDKSLNKEQRRTALRKEIRKIVNQRFDFQTMSKSVMANHWRKATGYERSRFVDFFSQNLEITYFGALESYSAEEIKYIGEKIKGDRAIVNTLIVSGTKEIPVNYKMKLNVDQWYVYDVVIENVSLVSNYRNLYTAIIKSDGIGGLLDNLEGRLAKYKKNPR